MKMPPEISATLLAPCGINCQVCYVHLRPKRACQGCRGEETAKPNHCRTCKIKSCSSEQGLRYCFQCAAFPCILIKRLDRSYRQRYQVSLIQNALRLQAVGEPQYLQEEAARWVCACCGGVISLQDQVCSICGSANPSHQPG